MGVEVQRSLLLAGLGRLRLVRQVMMMIMMSKMMLVVLLMAMALEVEVWLVELWLLLKLELKRLSLWVNKNALVSLDILMDPWLDAVRYFGDTDSAVLRSSCAVLMVVVVGGHPPGRRDPTKGIRFPPVQREKGAALSMTFVLLLARKQTQSGSKSSPFLCFQPPLFVLPLFCQASLGLCFSSSFSPSALLALSPHPPALACQLMSSNGHHT